ncbi:MAG: right-handed parallel beta-helix repeat-containing protein [Clostridia bacterium]|nr:right-handed parallel beta-helix repeat-containing protein [Clostridia bacterium]
MFGAKADGVTDDSEAIKKAVAALTDNYTLLFPTGHYKASVDEWGSVIKIQDLENVTIDFCNSTLEIEPNGHEGYNAVNVVDCPNFTIKNGTLIGDRKAHDYTTTSSTHEWCYGISVSSALTEYSEDPVGGGTIYGMNVSEFPGDAICLKNNFGQGTVVVDNCNLHHCRRQGISMLDGDTYVVKNTEIHHIGSFDGIKGAGPMTGIDIEPASGTLVVNNVVLENVYIHDTFSYNIVQGHNDYVSGKVVMNFVSTDGGLALSEGTIYECESCNFKVSTDESTTHQYASVFPSTMTVSDSKFEVCGPGLAATFINCDVTFVYTNHESNGRGVFYSGVATNSILRNIQLSAVTGNGTLKTTKNTTFYDAVFFGWTPTTFENCNFYGTSTNNLTQPFTFINCVFDAKPTGSGTGSFVYENCYDTTGTPIS